MAEHSIEILYPQSARVEHITIPHGTTINAFVRHLWHKGRRFHIEFTINDKVFNYEDLPPNTLMPRYIRCTVAFSGRGEPHKYVKRETDVAVANGYFTREQVVAATIDKKETCMNCNHHHTTIYAPHRNIYLCGGCLDKQWYDLFDRDLIYVG